MRNIKFKYITILLFSCIILIIYYFTSADNEINLDNLRVVAIIGWWQLIISIVSWKKLKNDVCSPYIIFLIALYIFTFGQSLLHAFNYISETKSLIGYMNITYFDIFDAGFINLLMLASFHIGAIISIKKETRGEGQITDNFYLYRRKILTIGWFLFIVSVIPFFYSLISNAILSITKGYGALYETEIKIGLDNILMYIEAFFIPAIICLFVGYKGHKIAQYNLTALILIIILLIFITGGRSKGVILIAMLILLYNSLIKPIQAKQYLFLAVLIFFLLGILSIIGNIRAMNNRNASTYKEQILNSAFMPLEAINEMGGSMFCLVKTKQIIENHDEYRYGKTYLYSLLTIIPNLNFWEIHPAKKEADLNNWLTKKLNLGYGTGFSMTAEAYINGGYFGILIMLFAGYIFGTVFSKYKYPFTNYATMIFILIIFWFSISTVRNSFINIIRGLFFYALPIYLYVKVPLKNKLHGSNICNRRSISKT